MAGNSNKQPNNWLTNILRPRASSITVESCLNLPNSDPSTPLDARPVLRLLEATQTLASRCKHLGVFSDICKTYKFTNLDNVFFAVQDILDPSMPREARHYVFEFMLACIVGQYAELGMARVTFYSFLKNYTYWEDFNDMFRVLSALCKGGRDVSGFEKNVSKLLIHWLDVTLDRYDKIIPTTAAVTTADLNDNNNNSSNNNMTNNSNNNNTIPYLSDILRLLTNTCKFNFALFEESEVTHMIEATHEAFFQSQDKNDINACLEFADIVVRYRFVPFNALTPFLDMLCAAVVLPDHAQPTLCWPIFSNLLRSHCAHSAILALCKFLEHRTETENPARGAIVLLSETAWGRNNRVGSENYLVSDSVLLLYLKKCATQQNDTINASILSSLILLLENHNTVSLMDWETVWNIVDVCTLNMVTVLGDEPLFHQKHQSLATEQYIKWIQLVMSQYNQKTYKGPVVRFMNVLYALKKYASEETACILLDYYVMEHLLLPSSEDWIDLLQDITETFFIHTHAPTIVRVRMLDIVTSVCEAVKDLYSDEINEKMVVPMMEKLYLESDPEIRQRAIDLIVASLDDCKNTHVFDKLLGILRECARCHCHVANDDPRQRAKKSLFHESGTDQSCLGVSPTLGLCDLFQRFLPTTNGEVCKKTFDVITDIANDKSDLNCPFGGPKLVALDLFLRLRCPTNHHLYLVHDNIKEENNVIASIRAQHQKRKDDFERKRQAERSVSVPESTAHIFCTSPCLVSFSERSDEMALDMNQILRSYIRVMTYSPNWYVVHFVLRRLPMQLSNKHLFCGAPAYINKLRKRLTRWTNTPGSPKFLENVINVPLTIKRNDLNIHAYSLLTVLISYRRVFSEPKQDQDGLVYAFYVGIKQVTSATRLCINSLSVCCHELPLSVAKMLNEILQRMSQIISVSSVSVHILEFLSGLARLPNLYANFTGDMYKPVFAIALNYLQHSRSQHTTTSPMIPPTSSPNTSPPNEVGQGALKQYVLIMAYLVITVWFTAIPLRERRKHVPFIIQRLLGGISMGKTIDEQTYTCIDMLSRFTFADVTLAPEKSIVSKILMGDDDRSQSKQNNQRTWVYGHTLLTLRTAKSLGWVEVTVRRPSGTVSMMCNIENKIKSDDIDYKTLPALLMMQYQPDLIATKLINEGTAAEAVDDSKQGGTDDTGKEDGDGADALGIVVDQYESEPPLSRQPSNTPTQATVEKLRRGSLENDGMTTSTSSTATSPMLESVVRNVLSDPPPTVDESPNRMISHLRKTEAVIDPGFLYLQLNNYPDIGRTMDISPPLPDDESTTRAIANFDRIPVVDFHKIGVLYVAKDQTNELEILGNTYGSPDYVRFLNALGTIQRLRGFAGNTGGLDREMDIDGKFAHLWKDDVTEAVFHVATMMPTNLDRDPQCSAKKRHIGNDYVSIVYNDSGRDYVFDTLPSQFNFINIVVSPHSISTETVSPTHAMTGAEYTFFKVEMQRRPDMPDIGPLSEPKLVSAQSLPGFVRQTAIHANIFAQVFWQAGAGGKREYVSHWRERLKQIQRIKERITKPDSRKDLHEALLDFTRYT